MKSNRTILILLAFVLVVAISFIFSKSYYPYLPIEGLSKREAVKLLKNSDKQIIKLLEKDQYSWYGYKGNQLEGSKSLIEAMTDKGWSFEEQFGGGYLFRDIKGTKKYVSSQMWTGKYVLYKVQR